LGGWQVRQVDVQFEGEDSSPAVHDGAANGSSLQQEATLMNLQAIETIVRRLFSDAAFRAEAIADPATALAEYRLAADERKALTKLCVQMAGNGSPAGGATQLGGWW
jgi:hypothetical protein